MYYVMAHAAQRSVHGGAVIEQLLIRQGNVDLHGSGNLHLTAITDTRQINCFDLADE
jgi:hypothetical protein